jgi:hypothetical protein
MSVGRLLEPLVARHHHPVFVAPILSDVTLSYIAVRLPKCIISYTVVCALLLFGPLSRCALAWEVLRPLLTQPLPGM